MTFPAERIGDKGQRYEVRYLDYCSVDVRDHRTLGWTDDATHADAMTKSWRLRPSVSRVWLCDRGTVEIYEDLLRRVEAEIVEDLQLNSEIYWRFIVLQGDRAREINLSAREEKPVDWRLFEHLPQSDWFFTTSIAAARSLTHRVFPDWWVTSGLCNLSGHASIGPDYNGPARERLLREFPVERFDGKFDCDLHPGGEIGSECRAILSCILQAQIAVMKERRGAPARSEGVAL